MRCALAIFAIFSLLGISARAQDDTPEAPREPTVSDLTHAAAGMAAIFARTASGIIARETLHQRGRRSLIRIYQKNAEERTKPVEIKLPSDFREHDVVSDYALGPIGEAGPLHEIRSVISIDGRVISAEDEARHALAVGFQSSDDELKLRLLENFERNRLEGAVTDFGQMILMFAAPQQNSFDFTSGGNRTLNGEPVCVLNYHQVSGTSGLTVFRAKTEEIRASSGEIWFRKSDLVPLRITMDTEGLLGSNLTIHDRAVVDYTPTPFGLAPAHIHHEQSLNNDLLVENDLRYSGYQRLTPGLVP